MARQTSTFDFRTPQTSSLTLGNDGIDRSRASSSRPTPESGDASPLAVTPRGEPNQARTQLDHMLSDPGFVKALNSDDQSIRDDSREQIESLRMDIAIGKPSPPGSMTRTT